MSIRLAGHLKGYEPERIYPIPDDIADYLMSALLAVFNTGNSDLDFVFPENLFRYNTFNAKVKEYANRIGLNGSLYTTHSLRATAATVLYIKTHDIYQVQRLLHHTTARMTIQYIQDLDVDEKLKESLKY